MSTSELWWNMTSPLKNHSFMAWLSECWEGGSLDKTKIKEMLKDNQAADDCMNDYVASWNKCMDREFVRENLNRFIIDEGIEIKGVKRILYELTTHDIVKNELHE